MNKIYVARTDDLNDGALFEKLYNTISLERRSKIDRFLFRKDKNLSLAAAVLLKKALRDEGIDLCENRFIVQYGPEGKPYIKDRNDVFFNLSHSESVAMCIIGDSEVGCDVEKVDYIDIEIARRFFYTSEYETIFKKKSNFERCDMFFRLWTLKESFMKATGLGMKLSLDSFRIDIETDGKISVLHSVNDKEYFFKEYNLNDGYKYAACGLKPNFGEAEIISLKNL